MISGTSKALGAIAGLLLLTSCESVADKQVDDGPIQTQMVDPFAPQDDFMLKFGMDNMGATTASEEALRSALYQFGVRNPNGAQSKNLRGVMMRVLRDSNRANGLGGIQARGYVEAVEPALQGNNYGGPLDPLLGVGNQWAKVTGQIQEEVVNKDGTQEPGFYFDAVNNSGYLWVLMITETSRGNSTKSIGQMFKVAVSPNNNPPGEIIVEPKVETADPNYNPDNVFPQFASVSGIRVNAAKADGYEFKLWANGEGIRVLEYWFHPNYDTTNPPDPNDPGSGWQKYHEGNATPTVESIFEADPMACLDMMFQEDPRQFNGGVLPPMLNKPPFYCLGRCKQPPIINTR